MMNSYLKRSLLLRIFHAFNINPRFQYLFHLIGTFIGFAVMIAIPLIFFLAPTAWASASILGLVLITLYGNFTTDYCGVSDSEASGHGAALRGIQASALHHRLAGRIFDRLTTDPHSQYRLHLILTYNWAVQAVLAILFYVFAHQFWDHYDILYTLLINSYTNFATDFSALPGTIAALHLREFRHGRSPWEPES